MELLFPKLMEHFQFLKANTDPYNKIKSLNQTFKIYKIGDCKEPRTMMEAIDEGFKIVYELDK